MKKILLSLAVIVVVAGAVAGGTVAFFNDTETSTGNVFTTGSVDMTVDSFGAIYNGEDVSNASWSARNLTSEKFFVLSDLKPADIYNRSISIHVANNPAWLCIGRTNLEDKENNLNDAEADAGDITNSVGELSKNVHVLVWKEIIPDLAHQTDEPILIDSFFDVFTDLPLRDSTTAGTGPTDPIQTELLAMSLCGGSHVVAPGGLHGGAVSCDGSTMGDQAQTDSLSADLMIYGEQHRNNPNFKCADVNLDQE